MTSEKMPADWAIERARGIMGWGVSVATIKDAPEFYTDALGVARYIEAHEKPPASRKLLCAREAEARRIERSSSSIVLPEETRKGRWDGKLKEYLEAITLWEEGFGK